MDSIELRRKDGKLYVVWVSTAYEGPRLFESWYDLRMGSYGRIGEEEVLPLKLMVYVSGSGMYVDPKGRIWGLPQGGAQLPAWTDKTDIPCPKVKADMEVRWNGSKGQWEKYLKTRGWVRA